MKIMADLDAVNLGLDENEADIAEELQDFDESFDTRSEASESATDSSDSEPSISSVSSAASSAAANKTNKKTKAKLKEATKLKESKRLASKRAASPAADKKTINGKGGVEKKQKKLQHTSGASSSASKTNKKIAENLPDKTSTSKTKKSSHKKSVTSPNGVAAAVAAAAAASNSAAGNKSDLSDVEDNKPSAKSSSESESEDSDSAANIKRNGRKIIVSPEKRSSLIAGVKSGAKSALAGKSYDYMTKLNYLFRDTRFFLIKSNNADNIALAKSKSVWATLPQNDANLCQAFKEARNVLLVFSVNESGKFAGFARMNAPSRRDIPQVDWVLPPSISSKALGGVIEIDWICRKELSFTCSAHLYNTWNDGKPVKIGRDGQEIETKVGAELCRLFPEDDKIELTPILRRSKDTAKMLREKGIRVVIKPPRNPPMRGGGHGGGGHGGRGGGGSGGFGYSHGDRRDGHGGGGIGPMRHRRSYGAGAAHHRPYKMLHGPPHRSTSPYRGGGGGALHGGGSRAGGGDAGLPPWERYMTSAAAAEAYVADYMRTMHGQLPPLPFVPPFAQLPLPGAGPGGVALPPGAPPTLYDQLPPPPVRYYDVPPLPDYPPPQAIRPPPPGFDKAPTYEDFAAWKNAGMPPAPGAMPPGFPGFSSMPPTNSGGSSGGLGNNMSGGAAAGANSYRNRDNNANANRVRERGGGAPRDYHQQQPQHHHRGGGNAGGGMQRGGGERERHFRAGGNERSGNNRNFRDGNRR